MASSSSHSNISSILNSSKGTAHPSKAATILSSSSNLTREATASRRRLNSSTGHLEEWVAYRSLASLCPLTSARSQFNDDQANARDPHYVSLRNAALQEGSLMHSAFDRASRAHDAGDGAAAKQLSNEGHMHQRKKDELNDQAADWIFGANNRDKGPGEVDLHGLYVQEAIERAERAVQVRSLSYRRRCAFAQPCLSRRPHNRRNSPPCASSPARASTATRALRRSSRPSSPSW